MNESYTLLAGTMPDSIHRLPPFSPVVMSFLQRLSQELLHDPITVQDPSWATFGFWLRQKQLVRLKQTVSFLDSRLGRGLVFHITPTNMPIMFAYSLAISLLAGNSNLVRLSPRITAATAPLCNLIDSIWKQPAFTQLYETNALITYDAMQKELTDTYTARCDGRIIWGGNRSIQAIRQSPLPPQAVELVFADRYSLAVFDSAAIISCSDHDIQQWAHRFYNDTYEADQNACSSPKLIVWLTASAKDYAAAQTRWWHAVAAESRAYDLQPIKVSEKYGNAWYWAMTCPELQSISPITNSLYIYHLSSLPDDITTLSGKFGQFFQIAMPSLPSLLPYITKKVQTISTLGISADTLRSQLIAYGAAGADRIVPVGQALHMDVIWDGTHMIESLSRIIR